MSEYVYTNTSVTAYFTEMRPAREKPCRVYWGSHGCDLERGHEGPHLCDCADIPAEDGGVGKPPYYGPNTTFYGEDTTAHERDQGDNPAQD